MEQEIAAQVVGLGGSSDFSLWKLFIRADFVVKFVIILLIASSIFSWALIFDKFKLFKSINASTEDFEKKFWKAKSAESFNNNLPSNSKDPATIIFKTAMNEVMKTVCQYHQSIFTWTHVDNIVAQKIMEKWGFIQHSRRKDWFAPGEDAYYYTYDRG